VAAASSAFVLHSYDWSESSLILELFTRDAGRVVAAAKGAKRPTSLLRAVLMPFQRIQVQFARSRSDNSGEVHTLRSAEWAGDAPTMHGAALFAGFYLNELLLRLSARDDPHPRLFDAYVAALHELGAAEASSEGHQAAPLSLGPTDGGGRREAAAWVRSESALRAFELLLLHESGVLPQLDRTTLTQAAVQAQRRYALRAEQGLVEASSNEAALGGSSCLGLAAALDAWPAQAADREAFAALQAACAADLQTLKAQLRAQLHYHLGGATLRTRQVMIDAQRLFETKAPAR
jgi:DNA repair protein RecO (recombination protein O)